MDDFLHNLRSGNLRKANPGNRRQHNDPHGKHPNRRVADRRKKDVDQRLVAESLETIKTLLQQLNTAQEQLANAQARQAKTEGRMAAALEQIAASLERRTTDANPAPPKPDPSADDSPSTDTSSIGDRIQALRDQSYSYARIADQLNQEGLATPSGRSQWSGSMVQRAFKRHTNC